MAYMSLGEVWGQPRDKKRKRRSHDFDRSALLHYVEHASYPSAELVQLLDAAPDRIELPLLPHCGVMSYTHPPRSEHAHSADNGASRCFCNGTQGSGAAEQRYPYHTTVELQGKLD